MTTDTNTALVLEGGGLRGVFTCGVLDCFMDYGVRFPFTVGVSAGACNGLSYMSRQRGRARISNIDLMDKHHYVGFKYLLTQGCIMDFKPLFEDFLERIIPYDYDAYFSNPERFVMVTTNCLTGKAKMTDENGNIARIKHAFIADSIVTTVGAMLGTSTTTTYVESAAGVAQGGRSGLTAFVIGCCFAVALLFSPLFLSIPSAATAPALIIVGLLMLAFF